jgi:hypothetical protein
MQYRAIFFDTSSQVGLLTCCCLAIHSRRCHAVCCVCVAMLTTAAARASLPATQHWCWSTNLLLPCCAILVCVMHLLQMRAVT